MIKWLQWNEQALPNTSFPYRCSVCFSLKASFGSKPLKVKMSQVVNHDSLIRGRGVRLKVTVLGPDLGICAQGTEESYLTIFPIKLTTQLQRESILLI